jgi:RNA polymerase sigma-70 factor (sigma-E family)
MMEPVATETRTDEAAEGPTDLAALHAAHYRDLVRLAGFVLRDRSACEEVVQEAFAKMLGRGARAPNPDRQLAYVRSAVLNGARNRLTRQRIADRLSPWRSHPGDSVEETVLAQDESQRVLALLRRLPRRQRECLLLRFYLDLPEREIASTLGIGDGSVKTHVHRGLRALAAQLEGDGPTKENST